jgi:hypothetical protein
MRSQRSRCLQCGSCRLTGAVSLAGRFARAWKHSLHPVAKIGVPCLDCLPKSPTGPKLGLELLLKFRAKLNVEPFMEVIERGGQIQRVLKSARAGKKPSPHLASAPVQNNLRLRSIFQLAWLLSVSLEVARETDRAAFAHTAESVCPGQQEP